MLHFLLWVGAALNTPTYPVSEWFIAVGDPALEAVKTDWSGSTFRIVYFGRDETPERWSRRITTYSMPSDFWGPGPVAAQTANAQEAVVADCPGARSGPLRSFTWSGRAAAEFWIACDLLPTTGRPDHYLLRMVSGETHLLAAAVTFRAPPTPAQVTAAGAYLDRLVICTEPAARPACRRVPAPPTSAAD